MFGWGEVGGNDGWGAGARAEAVGERMVLSEVNERGEGRDVVLQTRVVPTSEDKACLLDLRAVQKPRAERRKCVDSEACVLSSARSG